MMRITVVVMLVILVLAGTARAAPQPVLHEAKATISGTVLQEGLVELGAQVEEDQPLVYVRTGLTGRTDIAARSRWKGVVRDVLVRPGQRVEPGDILVRIEPR